MATIDGSPNNDILDGTEGDDIITGLDGNDVLNGLGGDDQLSGGSGDDQLNGGSGTDRLTGSAGDDTLKGGIGDDSLIGGPGSDTASYEGSDAAVTVDLSPRTIGRGRGGDAEGDGLISIENLIGSDHDDTLIGDRKANTLDGGAGSDTVSYSVSDKAVRVDLASNAAQRGGHAKGDRLISIENLLGTQFGDTLTGNASANTLTSGGGDDTLNGRGGADTLDGGAGNDTASYADSDAGVTVNLSSADAQSGGHAEGDILISIETLMGSAHADTLTGDGSGLGNALSGGGGDDLLIGGAGGDLLVGGAGNDTVSYAASDAAVTVDLSLVAAQSGGHAEEDDLISIESLIGSDHGDTLTGDEAANVLTGGGGDDTLNGRGGADTLDGGGGNDTVSYADSEEAVTVNLEQGDGVGGHAEGDTLANIENLTGSDHDDTLGGNEAANTLTGGAGNDTLNGRAGADTLDGGEGTDTANYADSDAGVTVDLSSDKAQSGGHAEGDVLISIENLTGSDHDDTLTADGSGIGSLLNGGGGDDNLTGSAGEDLLEGGAGDDLLIGGAGGDLLLGDEGNDTASYAGSDAGVTIDLENTEGFGGHAEEDSLIGIENLIGSAHDDTLGGDAEANNLDGGGGSDTVSYSASDEAVQVDLSSDKAQSGGYADGDVLTNIENLTGSDHDDTLTGNAEANSLAGGAGDDTLAGGEGADVFRIAAEAGNDTITDFSVEQQDVLEFRHVFANLGAVQAAATADGDDLLIALPDDGGELTIRNFSSDQLTAETVRLIVLPAPINGTPADDILNGTAGDDMINGLAGDDTLNSSAGADALDGGDGNDTASYAGSDAAVTVDLSSEEAQSGGHAEGDTLANIENLVGSAYFDALTGDANDNTLTGGAGIDVLVGGAGNDRLEGDADNDFLLGDEGNDHLEGGAGNDTLNGGDGNDHLDGGESNDNLTGGDGADVFRIAANAGDDTITDFSVEQQDVLEFREVFANLDAVQAAARVDAGNLLITLPNDGGVLTVQGLNSADQLTAETVMLTGDPVDPDPVVPVDPDPVDPVPVDPGQGGAGQGGAGQGQGGAGQGQGGAGGALPPTPPTPTPQEDIKVQVGTAADDVISGDTGDDAITSAEGADRVDSSGGADTLFGRSGNDTLNGEQGDDVLFGESGDDQLAGGDGNDRLLGGSGNDTLEGGAGADTLHGGLGDDRLKGGAGKDVFVITPDSGHEQIVDFNVAQDRLDLPVADASAVTQSVAENGNIIIDVAGTRVTLQGITDFATVPVSYSVPQPLLDEANSISQSTAANGNVVLTWDDFGPEHYIELPDVKSLAGLMIDYQAGLPDENNLLFGRTGNNVLLGGTGGDVLMGAALSDLLIGRGGHDVLFGGASTDLLAGRGGNDLLLGDAGDDILRGGAGDDLIWGGAGDNRLFGNAGADQFVISDGRNEQILDFNMEEDSLLLFTDKADSVQDLQVKSAIVDGLSGTQIALGNGNTVHLVGVDSAAVASLEIMFY